MFLGANSSPYKRAVRLATKWLRAMPSLSCLGARKDLLLEIAGGMLLTSICDLTRSKFLKLTYNHDKN